MRILDRILGRRLETTGELGYFGLTGWWMSSFSTAERDYMEAAFCTAGLPAGTKPLTRDRGLVTFPTSAALLTVLAGRLSEKTQDRALASRVLAQAEERALAEGDILGRHFVYHQMIRLHTRWKDEFADAADLIFAACHKQIQLAGRRPGPATDTPRRTAPDPSGLSAGQRPVGTGRSLRTRDPTVQTGPGGWLERQLVLVHPCMTRKLDERNPVVKSISSSGIRWL